MILIDLSQTMYSVLFQNLKDGLNPDLFRSMIFTTLLSHKKKFGNTYGAPVLALDSRNGYWRKDVYEYYKAHRAEAKKKSDLPWDEIYGMMNEVTTELRECLPWKCLCVSKAEADDIIGILAFEFGDSPTLIISSDKDYYQTHGKRGVKQYAPMTKKFITVDDPARALEDLIIAGDGGDHIPNIRSPRDSFVTGTRQQPITEKFKEEWRQGKHYQAHKDRYEENKKLIDFSCIPVDIKEAILKEFEKPVEGSINKLYKLFLAKRMNRLLSDLDLFRVKVDDYAIRSEECFFQ